MRQTPLYKELTAIGGKVVDFHGWALPVQFSGIVQEHEHTRKQASLFDCSHMGEFVIRGAEAVATYDRLVMTDVAKLKVGRGRYGAFLGEDGGILDDAITVKLADDELFVVTNAGPLETISARILDGNPGAENVSDTTAKIDIQGPRSREVLLAIGLNDASELRYFQAARSTWNDTEIVLSRTGYTGELGYELYMPNEIAPELWRTLLAHEVVEPAGLGARDTLRTELGYGLSGQDFDSRRTPLEASLDYFIDWDSDFIGKEALLKQREEGGYEVLTPIRTDSRRAPRHDFEVSKNGNRVGVVTSGTYGPSVGHGIGLAYLSQEAAAPGTALQAGPKGLEIQAATLPFYTAGTCRQ